MLSVGKGHGGGSGGNGVSVIGSGREGFTNVLGALAKGCRSEVDGMKEGERSVAGRGAGASNNELQEVEPQ
jgi:hypothetical protein